MDRIAQLAKEEFSLRLRRSVTDEEAAEHAMHLRRFAAFLIDCSKDKALMARLRLTVGEKRGVAPSVALRAMNSTSLEGGNPVRAPLLAETDPPTASSGDALSPRDSSALAASAAPAEQPTATLINQSTTGASVNGST